MSEPVEIKVTVSGAIKQAVKALDLDKGTNREIWFLDDLTPGVRPTLPLFAAGVVLRLRTGGNKADSTVKLRPCRRTQLVSRWARPFETDDFEFRIEADWAGKRRSLAASAVAEIDPDLIKSVTTSGNDPGIVITPWQKELLSSCTSMVIVETGLTPLGPISARKWKDIKIGDFDVNAERWSVGNLDFLELSIRVEADPEGQQTRFEAAIKTRGLTFQTDQETKTSQVLTELARMA